jgi:hypothetical protein
MRYQKLRTMLAAEAEPSPIATAARQIDRKLMSRPASVGESRFDNYRVEFVRPLGIQYEILEDVSTVIVHDVWRTDRK